MTEENKQNINEENKEKKPIYKQKKGIIGIIIGVCCIGILIIAAAGMFSSDKTGTNVSTDTDSQDPFNGKNAKMENVTISSSYGYFDVNGKIMFKNSESVYTELSAVVTLNDGSKVEESIVKNWNNVEKDQWYQVDGNLFSTSGNDYSLSDIKSVDFTHDGETIYTWTNE
ncbi:hypothetical protein [Methanobrevibacter sp.]|uniref:hypothetical protein n=1 Tax=Methanobrevibacter sp. TaxID=66852 RepID=UPI00261E6A40|nr:hypothetical protein [uncultured Methanobrevibacter sp.]